MRGEERRGEERRGEERRGEERRGEERRGEERRGEERRGEERSEGCRKLMRVYFFFDPYVLTVLSSCSPGTDFLMS